MTQVFQNVLFKIRSTTPDVSPAGLPPSCAPIRACMTDSATGTGLLASYGPDPCLYDSFRLVGTEPVDHGVEEALGLGVSDAVAVLRILRCRTPSSASA